MVVLIVHFTVRPGTESRALELMRTMGEHSRHEPGCVMYVGHQSAEDSRHFCFYEQYRDPASLDAHRQADYFQRYVIEGLDKIIEKRTRETFRVLE